LLTSALTGFNRLNILEIKFANETWFTISFLLLQSMGKTYMLALPDMTHKTDKAAPRDVVAVNQTIPVEAAAAFSVKNG
jgi:hypothetical protein